MASSFSDLFQTTGHVFPWTDNALQALLEGHLEKLALKNYTENTLKVRRAHIEQFLRWAAERGLTDQSRSRVT